MPNGEAKITFTANTTQLDQQLAKSQANVTRTGAGQARALEQQLGGQFAGAEKPFLKVRDNLQVLPGISLRAGAGMAAGIGLAVTAASLMISKVREAQREVAELNKELGGKTLDTAGKLSRAGIDSAPVLKAIGTAGGTASADQLHAFASMLADRGFKGSGEDAAGLVRAYAKDSSLFGDGSALVAAGLLGHKGEAAKEAALSYRARKGKDLDPAMVQQALLAEADPRLPRPSTYDESAAGLRKLSEIDKKRLPGIIASQPPEVRAAREVAERDLAIKSEQNRIANTPEGWAATLFEQRKAKEKLENDKIGMGGNAGWGYISQKIDDFFNFVDGPNVEERIQGVRLGAPDDWAKMLPALNELRATTSPGIGRNSQGHDWDLMQAALNALRIQKEGGKPGVDYYADSYEGRMLKLMEQSVRQGNKPRSVNLSAQGESGP